MDKLRDFYYAVTGSLAFFSFFMALAEDPDPTNTVVDSGFYSAFIVLCVTSIAILESLRPSESLRQ